MIRINKYLSMCGLTSRRGAEVFIKERRVTINDITLDKLGVIVDEASDVVKVDGVAVVPVSETVYVVMNKPRAVMTTLHDPFKRPTIVEYLTGLSHRVYPVGRLDYDSEGVLILSNDGDFAFRLAHPKYGVKKIYEARVRGHFQREHADRIVKGIRLDDGAIGRAENVSILGFVGRMTRVRLILSEGRKREVKQLCKKVGFPVERLVRVDFGGITLRNLRAGQWRHLANREIQKLKSMVGL